MNDRLHRLSSEFGQSPWLDNLQRSFITSGKLLALIESGVRGLTSNPTIFQKAIQGSSDYDDQFLDLLKRGSEVRDIYWELVVADIEGALELFAPLYESSDGRDGFVSVEVDPSLAHDTSATLAAARELHERISRPNVMIKIPATKEGLPAIRAMIAEGRNVNVTLIFSVERYSEVMNAYIEGLEERAKRGLPLVGIQSVASFFISRVDNEIDKLLLALNSETARQLMGTSAINQARIAYAEFEQTFNSDRWRQLANLGASVQRPLWASTSTKNPSYPDTLYVDELIGKHTVNTLPESTLDAFIDHGTLGTTISQDVEKSRSQWQQLGDLGIDTAAIAHQLEHEGVSSFIASFNDLIGALDTKRASAT